MYQFTEMFGELKGKAVPKTYRWRGLAAGLGLGWIAAWGTTHWQAWGGWAFAGIWLLCLPVGYGLGSLVKKS